ncbi:membrane protein [Arthrobacter sp. RIT-PI-e]|nr:membrane protein [Arthrobacter sp. RIT-PI-e]
MATLHTPQNSSSAPDTAGPGSDRLRQVVVTVSEIVSLLGPLIGFGLVGSQVNESSGGDLSSDATLIAPGGPAFSIWSVIYLGLFVYTILQWLPSRARDPRIRATGWLAALSMLLNAAWLVVTQQGWIWVSVLVIIALLATLVQLVRRLADRPAPSSVVDRIVVDGTFGLYLGWVAVATAANIAAALVSSGVAATGSGAEWASAALVLLLAGALTLLQSRVGGRWAVTAASVWGLAWIAVARLSDQPESTVVAVAAVVAALLVPSVTAVVGSRRRSRSPRTDNA